MKKRLDTITIILIAIITAMVGSELKTGVKVDFMVLALIITCIAIIYRLTKE